MSKPKVHFEVWEQPPNESDPEGWSYLICGREDAEEATDNIKSVTCKICLREIEKYREKMINSSFSDSQRCY